MTQTDLTFKPVNEKSEIDRKCPTCNGHVFGRSDKIFCTPKCKNKHHALARQQINPRFSETQKALKRNFIILEGILGTKHNCMSIHRDELFKRGFNFSKNTDKYRRNGKLVAELGDFHYSFTKDGMVIVRRLNPLIHVVPGFFERWEVDFPYDTAIFDEFIEEFESRFMRWME